MKLALACTVALASLAASALGYSDKEYAAIAELPHLDLLRSEKVTISIDAPNTATNQFEIWFCADENATRAGRDFLIGFDDGITVHGLQSASSVTTIAENPSSGNFSIRLVYRTSTLRPKPKTVNPAASARFAMSPYFEYLTRDKRRTRKELGDNRAFRHQKPRMPCRIGGVITAHAGFIFRI